MESVHSDGTSMTKLNEKQSALLGRLKYENLKVMLSFV